jgi:hypothetical protein
MPRAIGTSVLSTGTGEGASFLGGGERPWALPHGLDAALAAAFAARRPLGLVSGAITISRGATTRAPVWRRS